MCIVSKLGEIRCVCRSYFIGDDTFATRAVFVSFLVVLAITAVAQQ